MLLSTVKRSTSLTSPHEFGQLVSKLQLPALSCINYPCLCRSSLQSSARLLRHPPGSWQTATACYSTAVVVVLLELVLLGPPGEWKEQSCCKPSKGAWLASKQIQGAFSVKIIAGWFSLFSFQSVLFVDTQPDSFPLRRRLAWWVLPRWKGCHSVI